VGLVSHEVSRVNVRFIFFTEHAKTQTLETPVGRFSKNIAFGFQPSAVTDLLGYAISAFIPFHPLHPLYPRRYLLKVCRQVWKGEGAMAIQYPLTESIIGC
jgi:hypothetical protein